MATLVFEEALRTELAALTGLTNKVVPMNAIEGTAPPYVAYKPDVPVYDKTLQGFLESGVQRCTLFVVESTQAKVIALAKAVAAEVRGWLGAIMATTGPSIQDVTVDEESDAEFIPETGQYVVTIGFEVRF